MDPMGMLILTYWLPSPISIPSFPSSPNLIRMLNVRRMGPENNIYTWWLNQPIWKICNRQIGSFPQVRMKTNKMKPPDMNSSGMLIHPRKFNIAPTKMMVGRWVSFWDCLLVKFPGCKNSLRQSNLRYGTFFFLPTRRRIKAVSMNRLAMARWTQWYIRWRFHIKNLHIFLSRRWHAKL